MRLAWVATLLASSSLLPPALSAALNDGKSAEHHRKFPDCDKKCRHEYRDDLAISNAASAAEDALENFEAWKECGSQDWCTDAINIIITKSAMNAVANSSMIEPPSEDLEYAKHLLRVGDMAALNAALETYNLLHAMRRNDHGYLYKHWNATKISNKHSYFTYTDWINGTAHVPDPPPQKPKEGEFVPPQGPKKVLWDAGMLSWKLQQPSSFNETAFREILASQKADQQADTASTTTFQQFIPRTSFFSKATASTHWITTLQTAKPTSRRFLWSLTRKVGGLSSFSTSTGASPVSATLTPASTSSSFSSSQATITVSGATTVASHPAVAPTQIVAHSSSITAASKKSAMVTSAATTTSMFPTSAYQTTSSSSSVVAVPPEHGHHHGDKNLAALGALAILPGVAALGLGAKPAYALLNDWWLFQKPLQGPPRPPPPNVHSPEDPPISDPPTPGSSIPEPSSVEGEGSFIEHTFEKTGRLLHQRGEVSAIYDIGEELRTHHLGTTPFTASARNALEDGLPRDWYRSGREKGLRYPDTIQVRWEMEGKALRRGEEMAKSVAEEAKSFAEGAAGSSAQAVADAAGGAASAIGGGLSFFSRLLHPGLGAASAAGPSTWHDPKTWDAEDDSDSDSDDTHTSDDVPDDGGSSGSGHEDPSPTTKPPNAPGQETSVHHSAHPQPSKGPTRGPGQQSTFQTSISPPASLTSSTARQSTIASTTQPYITESPTAAQSTSASVTQPYITWTPPAAWPTMTALPSPTPISQHPYEECTEAWWSIRQKSWIIPPKGNHPKYCFYSRPGQVSQAHLEAMGMGCLPNFRTKECRAKFFDRQIPGLPMGMPTEPRDAPNECTDEWKALHEGWWQKPPNGGKPTYCGLPPQQRSLASQKAREMGCLPHFGTEQCKAKFFYS